MIDPVTSRYTEAFFNLAKRHGALDAIRKDVERFGRELPSPAVQAFLFDARIDKETRRQKLGPLLEGMHELTRNFVNLLFDKNRDGVLRGLPAAFHRRLRIEDGATDGVVESARPIEATEISNLQTSLGARLSKKVHLINKVVPELVGGVRVIVDNKLIDYSVQGRLEGLRKRLTNAELPSTGA